MGRDITGNCVPLKRRVLHPRPLQHLEVAASRCRRAGRLAPRARRILFVGPLEQLKVTSTGRGSASLIVPRTAASRGDLLQPRKRRFSRPLLAHPLQRLEVDPSAAKAQVFTSHGQGGSWPRAHCSTARSPWPRQRRFSRPTLLP
jgi:hypothetical protein